MKKLILVLLTLAGIFSEAALRAVTLSERHEVEAEIKADFVSQYIWRGQDLGDCAVEPTLGISWRGVSLSAWGNVGLVNADDTKEFDLTLGYSKGHFNIGVTDYWFNIPNPKYFVYASHKTSHVFEGNVGYDFGPVSLQWYTNFAGNDGVNKKGKRAYSSYMEVSAPFTLGGLAWCATFGAVPYRTSFYENVNGFAVTNVSLSASYDIKVSDSFAIPIFAAINTNPCTQKAAFVIGFTLQP